MSSNTETKGKGLSKGRLGVFGIVFFVVAASAPMAGMTGVVPVAGVIGNGAAVPGAYVLVGLILLLFSEGFTAMSHKVTNAGAFFAYVGRGLGKHLGVGSAFASIIGYVTIQLAIYGFFGAILSGQMAALGLDMPWYVWTIIAWVLVTALSLLSVDVGAKVPGLGFEQQAASGEVGHDVHPGLLGFWRDFRRGLAVLLHVDHQLGDPVHIVLADADDVGQGSRSGGAGGHEEIGESLHHESEVSRCAVFPFLIDGAPLASHHIKGSQRAREPVVTGGEDEHVQLELPFLGANALLGDLHNGLLVEVHQVHIGLVEGFVIAGVQTGAARKNRIATGLELFSRHRVFDHLADFVAHKIGHMFVGFFIDQQIRESAQHGQAAVFPRILEQRLALSRCDGEKTPRRLRSRAAHRAVARRHANARIVAFDLGQDFDLCCRSKKLKRV